MRSIPHRRTLGAEFWRDGHKFCGQKFFNDLFKAKILIFTSKISYNFLFSHRLCLFSICACLYCLK